MHLNSLTCASRLLPCSRQTVFREPQAHSRMCTTLTQRHFWGAHILAQIETQMYVHVSLLIPSSAKKYALPSSEIGWRLEPGLRRLYPGSINIFVHAHTQFHPISFPHVYILAQMQIYCCLRFMNVFTSKVTQMWRHTSMSKYI